MANTFGNSNCFSVYSMRIAQAMIRDGIDMVGARVNEQNPNMIVFYFANTPEAVRSLNRHKYE